jgi:cell wall-associated NlpC family hydrolase
MNPSNHDDSAPHWASQYIGLPWVAGSSDCWSFARRVWRERFGWDVAVINVDATSRLASLRAFDDHPEYGHWHSVSEPREGDACLMGKSERPSHIGIYLQANGGGVLHSLETAGVVFTPEAALPSVGLRVDASTIPGVWTRQSPTGRSRPMRSGRAEQFAATPPCPSP